MLESKIRSKGHKYIQEQAKILKKQLFELYRENQKKFK